MNVVLVSCLNTEAGSDFSVWTDPVSDSLVLVLFCWCSTDLGHRVMLFVKD